MVTNMAIEIPQKIRDRVRKRYGSIVDIIYLHNIPQPKAPIFDINKFEIRLDIKKLCGIQNIEDQITNELVIESAMIELCQWLEEAFFDREPNCDLPQNYRAIVTDNIPEGVIYMHPKTYSEICCKINL